MNWQEVLEDHLDIFVSENLQQCPEEKRKEWRLPTQFHYYFGGETALRVGVIISETSSPKEEDFLLAGLLWAHRLSNGAKTVIYFISPNFSPFFIKALCKIGETLSARAVFWREKLSPSLFLVPEQDTTGQFSIGESRKTISRWRKELNPVAQQQLDVVMRFFSGLKERRIRSDVKSKAIAFLWGDFEIAEVRRKGKKIEIQAKSKWEKNLQKREGWEIQGWVDSAGILNKEFCSVINEIIATLDEKEKNGTLKDKEHLSLWLHSDTLSTPWGIPLEWPWVSKDRTEDWVNDLGNWFYFEDRGQLHVVCPILKKPLTCASHSILLTSVLESSKLLKDDHFSSVNWDYKIYWLTLNSLEEELRLWFSWLKDTDQFKIWTLPEDWKSIGMITQK